MTRALAMISGGLDSILAAKLIKEQGIEVIGVCFRSYFFNEASAIKMTKQIDIPLEVVDFSEAHMDIVKNPKHGWGKNINPCIDCHTMMMKYSGELLKKFNADFIITGEVLNQRPMSQNKQALNIVKKESGYADKILRPLCAKNLPETEMEKNGLVDREKLLNISGRSRKRQMELAEMWGIKEYPSPAGGCRLTEPNYALKLKDALNHKEDLTEDEIGILRFGRHFRTENNTKIIATRTAEEADQMREYINESYLEFNTSKFAGSTVYIQGNYTDEDIALAASIAVRYSKGKDEDNVEVLYGEALKKHDKTIFAKAISDEELSKLNVVK